MSQAREIHVPEHACSVDAVDAGTTRETRETGVSGNAELHRPSDSGTHAIGATRPRSPRFTSSRTRPAAIAEGRAAHHAIVTIDPIVPSARGRLCEVIEDACDALLTGLGGAPAGMGAFGSFEESLRDRLFRANRVGRAGLTISLGSLRPIARAGVLAPEDSETLLVLCAFAIDRPLVLLLEEDDTTLGAFRDTTPLSEFFAPPSLSLPVPVPVPVPDPASVTVAVSIPTRVAPPVAAPAPEPLREPVVAPVDVPSEHVFLPVGKTPRTDSRAPSRGVVTVAPREHPWRAHAAALVAARGPQPLGEFERLFAQHYVPLTTAIIEGIDDQRARAAAEEFRHTFARSYAEAFPTFVVTGKRPRLVLDAPDLAGRAGRLHGARTVQLLLVDAMRWDIGIMVRDALLVGLGPRATLAEEGFLLAALPSTTPRQLAGIARGVDGLRSTMLGDNEGEALRGRTSEIVRRMRVGSRDLYKLDVVDARLREADGHAAELFPDIARRVSDAIVRHAQTLPPRTLLYVFGDHGFSLDAAGAVQQGGASPEEVLVPAFSFLLGMMQ